MGLFANNLITRADTVPHHITGITCDAKNCVYHDGDNYCTAEQVNIGRLNSRSSDDTRCATFELRGEITRGM